LQTPKLNKSYDRWIELRVCIWRRGINLLSENFQFIYDKKMFVDVKVFYFLLYFIIRLPERTNCNAFSVVWANLLEQTEFIDEKKRRICDLK
jgi:hypothetical protein